MKYETRLTRLVVCPVGEKLFCEMATEISIEDEAAGEYIKITQCHSDSKNGTVLLSPGDDLELVVAAIQRLAADCRSDDDATSSD